MKNQFIDYMNDKKYVIFGGGQYAKIIYKWIKDRYNVIAFASNDEKQHCESFMGG